MRRKGKFQKIILIDDEGGSAEIYVNECVSLIRLARMELPISYQILFVLVLRSSIFETKFANHPLPISSIHSLVHSMVENGYKYHLADSL